MCSHTIHALICASDVILYSLPQLRAIIKARQIDTDDVNEQCRASEKLFRSVGFVL